MGGDWRMPTEADFQELLDNTTDEWFTDYNGTGVKGRKFTSDINGNSIFIPAAGYYYEGTDFNIGFGGYFWGSSLNASNPSGACFLGFWSDKPYMGNYDRCRGLFVRGVL